MIYQKSTVMAHYQIKNIFSSPLQCSVFPSYLTPSSSLMGSTKKGCKSVTHYMNNQLPPCINHKKRRALYFSDVSEQGLLYFCQRCKEMLERQGFECKSIEEFNGSTPPKQNNVNATSLSKQSRRIGLDSFLLDIKVLHERANQLQGTFEESIQEELSKNSKQISDLFQELEKQIWQMKRTYETQIQENTHHLLNHYQEFRCTLAWTQEELQYLISKITKSMDRLMTEPDYYVLSVKMLRESLSEKERKISTAESAYNGHCQQFKIQNRSLTAQLAAKIQKMSGLFHLGLEISGINSFSTAHAEESKTYREIIGEMSTHHTLI